MSVGTAPWNPIKRKPKNLVAELERFESQLGDNTDGATCLGFMKVTELWDERTPKYLITKSLNVETKDNLSQYAFIVRDHVDRYTKESTTYIDVLQEVLCNVQSVSVMEAKPSVEQKILFHFISELEEYFANLEENDPRAKPLTILVDHLKETYKYTIERLAALTSASQITYDILWALFKPGCIVYTTCHGTGKQRGVIFDAGEERENDDQLYYQLECRFIDYDGNTFGEAGVALSIMKFRGAKLIHLLDAFPLQYHPDYNKICEDLVLCGRKFCGLTSTHFRHCRGSAFVMVKDQANRLRIDSRVAIDAKFFRQMMPNYHRPRVFNKKHYSFPDDFFTENRLRDQEKLKEFGLMPESMTDDHYMICSPTVQGFSFEEKIFLECAVGDLVDVDWNSDLFHSLRLEDETKNLLCSLMAARLQAVDEVWSKDNGFIVLLYIWSREDFTVEALSEQFQLPLYSISVSELIADHGDPLKLEWTLKQIFQTAEHFRAVLLLDEADIFMECRTSHHDSHNRIVTIFLRVLNHYNGFLFTTTNRVVEFDPAILTRVHMKVKYKQLIPEYRRDIWKYFLSRATTTAGKCIINESQITELASKKFNGREIRNIIQVARELADSENTPVLYRHVELGAKANDEFRKEFDDSHHI